MMNLAPIVLFVYNRLEHLQRTVEALQNNTLASHSNLYVFSDHAKDATQEANIKRVRNYLHSIDGFNNTTIIERDKNYGLANSIISGVNQILESHDKCIVLEDDLITSEHFLSFINDGLNIYKDDANVGMIHGHIYTIEDLPDCFFLRKSGCLGWGTWKDAWLTVNFDGSALLNEIESRQLQNDFDINGTYPYTNMLREQIDGKNSSWAVRVQASFFLNDMLTFYPANSLVQHIGFDEGTHCKNQTEASDFDGIITTASIKAKSIPVTPSAEAEAKLEQFFRDQKNSLWQKVVNFLSNLKQGKIHLKSNRIIYLRGNEQD